MAEHTQRLDWSGPPDKDIDGVERARRAVVAHKIIVDLPSEGFRRDKDLFNVRLYENNPVISLYAYSGSYYNDVQTLALPPGEQSVNNRAKAAIDTYLAQVGSTEQRARVKSIDGNYKQRKRTRELQNFADGLAMELELTPKKRKALQDSAILESGVGALIFYEKDGRVACKRILATELAVDPLDGLTDGYPRRIYWRRPVPRAEVYGLVDDLDDKKREIIDLAKPIAAGGAPADHIEVYECWALPTGDDTKDGWHIIALDVAGGALVVEQFTRRRHDIVMLNPEPRTTTVWGRGMLSQVRALQLRINANEWRGDKMRRLFSAGHLYLNRMNKVNKASLTNEIGSVWEGNSDTPPQYIQPPGVGEDFDKKIERDGQLIFSNLGINVGASTGTTALGANAPAEALREEDQKADKRNSLRQQAYEAFHVECIKTALGIVADIVGDGGGSYKVAVNGKRGLSRVDWKNVAQDEKNYAVEIMPASAVPTEPGALVAWGEKMIDMHVWKPRELQGYLQDLDSDGRTNRQMSQERNLEKLFEELTYEPRAAGMPDEFTNYQLAIEIGTEYLEQGKEDGVPEKHLERVRRYLKKCKDLAKRTAAAGAPAANAPAQQGAPAGGPGAAPPAPAPTGAP